SFGSTSLVQVGSNFFFDPVAGGTGPELSYQNKPVTVGEFGAWTPLGVEATASGYEVAWKNGGTDQYTIWQTNSSGNYVSDIGVVSGTSATLENAETSFHQDLNGDGVIGVPSGGRNFPTRRSADLSFGSTSLVQVGSNFFFDPVAGGAGPEL